MLIRRFLPLGLALGLLAGIAAAVLVPRTRAQSPPAVQPAPPAAAAGIVRTARPRLPSAAQVRFVVVGGAPRVVARRDDPDGGPGWALRVAHVARVVPKAIRRRGVDPVVGHERCAQLVRLRGREAGWLDQRGTFRRAVFEYGGAPMSCLPEQRSASTATLEVLSTLRFPEGDPARARLGRGVAYGLVPPGSATTLRVDGRAVAVDPAAGAFLALADPGLKASAVTVTSRTSGGTVADLDDEDPGGFADAVLVARAPDPAGGLPYAAFTFRMRAIPGLPAAVRQRQAGVCVGSGARIVDDAMGTADLALGTFSAKALGGGGGCGVALTRKRPINYGYGSSGGGGASDPDASSGRTTRRLQPGRTTIYGLTLHDVDSITIATPRDVRTLIPSGPQHAFIAVYDGTFPAGELVLTARFGDGTTAVQRSPLGGP